MINRLPRIWIGLAVGFLSIIIAIASFFVFKVVLAWTNPTQAPPGGSGSGLVPSGQVAFFNLGSCPSGWTEATSARGRYVVGKPSGGTLAGTAGTALSNLENRAVGQHNHGITGSPALSGSPSISDPGHTHTLNVNAGAETNFVGGNLHVRQPGTDTSGSSVTGITVGAGSLAAGVGSLGTANAGSVAGTNAPYIQYLVCQKD